MIAQIKLILIKSQKGQKSSFTRLLIQVAMHAIVALPIDLYKDLIKILDENSMTLCVVTKFICSELTSNSSHKKLHK